VERVSCFVSFFGKLVLAWILLFCMRGIPTVAICLMLFPTFLRRPLNRPYKDASEPLLRASKDALEIGDVEATYFPLLGERGVEVACDMLARWVHWYS
jgi:hypothetical protein